MSDKTHMSGCGAQITEQHYYRNIARDVLGGLLRKDKTLPDQQAKALRLFAAREFLTKALMATPEGQALLIAAPPVELPLPETALPLEQAKAVHQILAG